MGKVISAFTDFDAEPVNPDPYSESRSGSRRAKITHKSEKKEFLCSQVLDVLF
jgi:hypothetical protein